jgi:hypothetical protein
MEERNKEYVFKNEAYNLSTDYDYLWFLIQNGLRIPAWIMYNDKYEKPIWDLVEVKNTFGEENDYSIGTRGIGYEGAKNFQSFKDVCKMTSLHFIMPFAGNHSTTTTTPR